ncbi:MAG: alpha/beta hydrolase [Evtepia sp.]
MDQFRERIDPELLSWYDASNGFDFEHLETFVPAANAAELTALTPDPEVFAYDKIIPGPDGNPELKLRIYEPVGRKDLRPCVLFFHGGGFLFGTVYRQEKLCQRYVKHVNCVVVSVEYRLAPKYKSPAPIEDGYAALCWLEKHGKEVGVDAAKIALAGLSAGGTIVAALAMMARDRKGPGLCLQIPLYAELDHRLETVSAQEVQSPKVWCYETNRLSWELYLTHTDLNPYAVPALATDLSHLPPLFSYVGGLDPVRDENLTYWSRMMQSGIAVEAHTFPGCYHCFELSAPEAHYSKTAYELTYAAMRRAFA